ncbi:hypothetical protein SteCoe_27783 [Stentor coeruleus]|uniref:Uncharacterized protein n=1 Tax=Stentor coeruleus TaxID=5963 RepID=A0A1R2B9S5_9CILI|nr:hypothetical protein SteCoe_27783 [Stentor coeruleus]
MDLQDTIERKKFLLIFGAPYKSFLGILTLKSAIISIAILDILIGVYYISDLIIDFFRMIYGGYMYSLVYLITTESLLGGTALGFAIIGFRGCNRLSPEDISVYSKYKHFELFVQTIVKILVYISVFKYQSYYYASYYSPYIPKSSVLFFIIIGRIIQFILVKVIWSAEIRMKNNQMLLFQHGEKTAEIIQTQARNLANPKIITPATNIYFASPYSEA